MKHEEGLLRKEVGGSSFQEVKRDMKRGKVALTQSGYIKRMTKRFEITKKTAHTPMIGLER